MQRYIDAHDRLDPEPVIAMLRDDSRLAICPMGMVWDGRDQIVPSYRENMGAIGHFRSIAFRANREPAVAHYMRRFGETDFVAFSIAVLRFENGSLVDFTTFAAPELFAAFGLPEIVP